MLKKNELRNRILDVINNTADSLLLSNLDNSQTLGKAEEIYKKLKEVYNSLPQSKGKGIAHGRMMVLYKLLVDKRKKIISDEFNSMVGLIVNLIDKSSRLLESNDAGSAMRCYSQAASLFSELPENSFLEPQKNKLKLQIKFLYDKILFSREIENDMRFGNTLHSINILLERCKKLASSDREAAQKIYNDILLVYSSLGAIPDAMLWKVGEIKAGIEELDLQLSASPDFFKLSPALKTGLSDELLAVIASNNGLKSQKGFDEFISLLHFLESCRPEDIQAAREKFDSAKRILRSMDGSKKAVEKILEKVRGRLELMSLMERLRLSKDKDGLHVTLAVLQRKTFDYNLKFSEDIAFSDSIYEKCALLHSILEEGLTLGELKSMIED